MVEKVTAPVSTNEYNEDQIIKLNPMEHVRLRPGMYVGGTDARALHHLIYEVVDNSIDEALAGRCDHILVTLYDENVVSVADNGVGIPVGIHKTEGVSTLQMVMTEIGTGGKFNNSAYKVSGGLHGVGVSAVNALVAKRSQPLSFVMAKSGSRRTTRASRKRLLRRSVSLNPVKVLVQLITFKPDFTVMEPNEFNFATLAQRFREMAFITRKVTITLRDERLQPFPHEITFYFEDGVKSFVSYLNRTRATLHPVFTWSAASR